MANPPVAVVATKQYELKINRVITTGKTGLTVLNPNDQIIVSGAWITALYAAAINHTAVVSYQEVI